VLDGVVRGVTSGSLASSTLAVFMCDTHTSSRVRAF
jgi:hypothetical protein